MRILHLSDLHFGHHDAALAAGLAADIASQHPDLVVVSGDFTQIGSRSEFAAARGLSLYAPVIVKYRDSSTDAATVLEDALR